MTLYVRAKRKQTTAFLYAESGDKVSTLKDQIANLKLEDRAVSASAIKLLSEEGHEALNDEQTIEEAKIENDNVIYFVFKKDGSDDWESVDVQNLSAPAKSESSE